MSEPFFQRVTRKCMAPAGTGDRPPVAAWPIDSVTQTSIQDTTSCSILRGTPSAVVTRSEQEVGDLEVRFHGVVVPRLTRTRMALWNPHRAAL